MEIYKPNSYTIEELAHPQIIEDIGEDNAWLRFDKDCLLDLQFIRDEWHQLYGSGIYCNRLNLELDSRGLRPPNDPDGSFYSTHKQGTTFDLEPVNGLNETLFIFISALANEGHFYKLNTMEDFSYTKTWVHVGYMNHDKQLLIIEP